ncbi:MAG: 2-hydroxyacyl-CoA dehydratase family protein [Verrucomicrobiae bacterium]|nr:2-hydroxyacyl-CoA dehydratase family protein [Verrucomicrobiae bacterium]
MNALMPKLDLAGWDRRYAELQGRGLHEAAYGGPLRRHVERDRDFRLEQLQFDGSAAALRLWNFLLTENERLHQARGRGEKIVGTMKDLGTVPVMAYALPGLRAFYPDGAWWTPCLMEGSDQLLQQAEALGIDASFCPVRAMLPAFQNGEHFPRPDLLICSTGAVCDDFSAIAQRLEHLGHAIFWWEMPRRRAPEPGEGACVLPGNLTAPSIQVDCVRLELERVRLALAELAGVPLDDARLADGIRAANRVRRLLAALRQAVYAAPAAPLPALEMLVAEMLAIHFCSDREETVAVLAELLAEAQSRLRRDHFVIGAQAVRVFWVNPVADLRAMNLLEDCGGRLAGADFMFSHALDLIPEDLPPLEALARTALADPMVGPATDRAARVVRECRANRAEAVVIARIPGASHCAREGEIIRQTVRQALDLPVIELEIPPVSDAMLPALASRLQAVVETALARRSK